MGIHSEGGGALTYENISLVQNKGELREALVNL
jgi:hypothetical protein